MTITITPRNTVKRTKQRANYDRKQIYQVLDNSLIATISFVDHGDVHGIPMLFWRHENFIYLHGSNGSRLIKTLLNKIDCCVTIAEVDGIVLARSAFHHSVNYQSVCIYGQFEKVDEALKEQTMEIFFNHWLPDRWQHVRLPSDNELAATTFIRLKIQEAVLKCREGPPIDDDEDMQQAVWAGYIPLQKRWQSPIQAPEQTNINLPGKNIRN